MNDLQKLAEKIEARRGNAQLLPAHELYIKALNWVLSEIRKMEPFSAEKRSRKTLHDVIHDDIHSLGYKKIEVKK